IVRGPAVEEEWANVAANRFPAGVTIEADIPQTPWRLPANARDTKAILTVANMDGIKFKGFAFDGQGRAENGIYLTARCPGVIFEDCSVRNCKDAAVKVSNAAGDEGRPIRFVHLRLYGGAANKSVIHLYAAPNLATIKANHHIVFHDCQVNGPAHALVLVEGSADALRFSHTIFANSTSGVVFRPLGDARWTEITIQDNTFARVAQNALQIDTTGATIDARTFTIRDNQFANCKNVLFAAGNQPLPALATDGNVRDAASGEGTGGVATRVGEVKLPMDLPISK